MIRSGSFDIKVLELLDSKSYWIYIILMKLSTLSFSPSNYELLIGCSKGIVKIFSIN